MQNCATLHEDARVPWNKGKLIGQKPPLKLAEIWTVRTQLRMVGRTRELALFNLAIDTKLRGCDLVSLRARDVAHGDHVLRRASIVQHKTHQPVRFGLTEQTRDAVGAWIAQAGLSATDYLFPSCRSASAHLSVRQYARLVKQWVALMGADPARVWYTLVAPDQGDADLPQDQESARGAATLGPSQDRVYGALSRYRSR